MREFEKRSTKLLHAADELRKLLTDNSDLPVLVLVGEDACGSDLSYYTACTTMSAQVGQFLDCWQDIDAERCFVSKSSFREALEDLCEYDPEEQTIEEFHAMVDAEVAEYDPYWKPCIILYVDN